MKLLPIQKPVLARSRKVKTKDTKLKCKSKMQIRQPVTFSIYYVTVNMEMCNKKYTYSHD